MAIANEEAVQGAAAQMILAQSPEQIGATVAALIVANNPQYAALTPLIAGAINAILLGLPVQVPGGETPQRQGGILGWLRRFLTGA